MKKIIGLILVLPLLFYLSRLLYSLPERVVVHAIGCIFIASGSLLLVANLVRKVLWVSSAAQVIEHIEAGTNKGKTLWRCKVRFLDTSQHQVEAVDKYAISTDPQPVGTEVIILYPHGRPDKVHCYSPLTFYAVPVLFVSIGIAALLAF